MQKERKQRQPKVDPEFVAFGLLLKDSLVYLYMGLYLICQISSYVLIKVRRRREKLGHPVSRSLRLP